MTDEHSRAYGLAHSVIMIELLKALLKHERLIPKDVHELLTSARNSLASYGTDVATAAAEHVKIIGEAAEASH